MMNLPPELLCRIAAYLSTTERVWLSSVCKYWRHVLHSTHSVWTNLEVRVSFNADRVVSWPSMSFVKARLGPESRLKHLTLVGPILEDLPWRTVAGVMRSSRYAVLAGMLIQAYGTAHLISLELEGWPSTSVAAIVRWLPQLRSLDYRVPAVLVGVIPTTNHLLGELRDPLDRRPNFSLRILPSRPLLQAEMADSAGRPLEQRLTGNAPAWGISDFTLHTNDTNATTFTCCRSHNYGDNTAGIALSEPEALQYLELIGTTVRLRLCPNLAHLTSIRIDGGLRFIHDSQTKVLMISLRKLEISQPKLDADGFLSATKFFSILRTPYLQIFRYSSKRTMDTAEAETIKGFRTFGVHLCVFMSKARQLKEFHLCHPMPRSMAQLFDETYETPSCFSRLEILTIANTHIPALIISHMLPKALPKLKILDCSKATAGPVLTRLTVQSSSTSFPGSWKRFLGENARLPTYT